MGRAWCFQERVLASRMLHFGSSQMYWECEHEFDEERDTIGLSYRKPYNEFSVELIASALKQAGTSPRPDVERQAWFMMVRQYTSRELSDPSDKLPALSGIVSELERYLPGDKCYAGIWKSWFARGMLWRVQNTELDLNVMVPKKSSKVDWRAPSWSFLSLEGVVLYETYHGINDTCAKLLECRLTLQSKLNPLGALDAGHAVLRAPMTTIFSIESQATRKGTPCMIQLRDGSLTTAAIFFDIDRYESAKALMITPHLGIALVTVDGMMDTYTRIGMVFVHPLWDPIKDSHLLRSAQPPERFLQASALPEPTVVMIR